MPSHGRVPVGGQRALFVCRAWSVLCVCAHARTHACQHMHNRTRTHNSAVIRDNALFDGYMLHVPCCVLRGYTCVCVETSVHNPACASLSSCWVHVALQLGLRWCVWMSAVLPCSSCLWCILHPGMCDAWRHTLSHTHMLVWPKDPHRDTDKHFLFLKKKKQKHVLFSRLF